MMLPPRPRAAVASRILGEYDPQRPGQTYGKRPKLLRAAVADLSPEPARTVRSAVPLLFLITQRMTGSGLNPAWLDQPQQVFRLPSRGRRDVAARRRETGPG